MENIIYYVIATILLLILIVSVYFLTRKNTTKPSENSAKTETKNTEEKTPEIKSNSSEERIEEIQPTIKSPKEKKLKPKVEIILPSTEKTQETEEKDLIIEDLTASINISPKTAQILLKKLNEFEKKKGFLNKDLSLSSLAKEFDTNTKYLSEIVKNFKQKKNFKQYVSELRLDYLIEKLNTDEKTLNTKISYLADQFGYNSHSMLSSHFTQYVGKTPVEYIKAIKEAKKQETEQE